jgi:hypothetical protein
VEELMPITGGISLIFVGNVKVIFKNYTMIDYISKVLFNPLLCSFSDF